MLLLTLLSAVAVLCASSATTAEASGGFTEFFPPTLNAGISDIVAGPDGNLWFTESNPGANKIGRITPSGEITEFSIAPLCCSPNELTVGPDGHLWFTLASPSVVGLGHLDPKTADVSGAGRASSSGDHLAAGADGAIWYTRPGADTVARLDRESDAIVEYPMAGRSAPFGIAAGPDRNLWVTATYTDEVARVTAKEGNVTEYAVDRRPHPDCLESPQPSYDRDPWEIAAGSDGAMWFTESRLVWCWAEIDEELELFEAGYMGRVSTTGAVSEPRWVSGDPSELAAHQQPAGIATAGNGTLWFTTLDSDNGGNLDERGTLRSFLGEDDAGEPHSLPDPAGDAWDLVLGPDGNLWYAALPDRSGAGGGNRIGRFEDAEPNTAYVLVMDAAFSPRKRTVDQGTTIRWVFQGPSQHGVKDKLGLLNSGSRSFVDFYSHLFTSAATYAYADTDPTDLAGTVAVPLEAPATGSVGTPFTVTWASAPPRPGYGADVQVKEPGRSWAQWQTGVQSTHADYTPSRVGRHQFRARLRKLGGKASGWSPVARVRVT